MAKYWHIFIYGNMHTSRLPCIDRYIRSPFHNTTADAHELSLKMFDTERPRIYYISSALQDAPI